MAKQWLAGVVKEVQSGDCVVIAGATRLPNGLSPEKRINLATLSAPRLPRRDGSNTSEEFAWESREFLRRLAIGMKCVFRVDYKVESIDREFGTVFVQRPDHEGQINLGLEVAKAGWAKVRETNDPKAQSPDYEALREAGAAAEAARIGVYQSDPDVRAAAVFSFDVAAAADAPSFVASYGKGRPVAAVVDQVLTGSAFKCITLADRAVFTFNVCGAQSPQVRRNASGQLEGEPFGLAAKNATEMKVLNKEVRCVMHQGEEGRVYGALIYEDDGKACSLADFLLEQGLAKYVEWSARMLPSGASDLKLKELAAKEGKLNMWTSYVPPPRNTAPVGNNFTGRVIEVQSGDTLFVKDSTGVEHRLSLASIRAPRMRPAGAASEPEPYAQDARDFLRKHLIGKEVDVRIEYSRKVVPTNAEGPVDAVVIQSGNITVDGSQGPQEAAEMVVRRGFATVQPAKEGEERSSIFGQLLEAEEYARGKRMGIHSGKEPGRTRTNDVSVPGSAARAKQYLPFFQRSQNIPGVVEHVMSGSRVKIFIPKESVSIAFSPSGVKTPSRGLPARGAAPAQAAEPFGAEAFAFARETLLQRDVLLNIESVDKNGTFLGRVQVGKVDFSIALLSAGLGSLHPSFSADRVSGAGQLIAAQEAAKAARKGVWTDYVESQDAEEEAELTPAANGAPAALKPVTVTHVSHGQCMHIQALDEPRVAWVAKEAAAAVAQPFDGWNTTLKVGMKVLAQFSADNLWYRGYIDNCINPLSTNAQFDVFFMDYGNSERLPASKLRPMDAALAAVAPLAQCAKLAYVNVPELSDEEFGYGAADALASLVGGGQKLMCQTLTVQRIQSTHARDAAGLAHVVLWVPGNEARNDITESINAEMLETGYARLPAIRTMRTPAGKSAVAALADFENVARKNHRGIFRYGDPGDSDDEEEFNGRGGRRR